MAFTIFSFLIAMSFLLLFTYLVMTAIATPKEERLSIAASILPHVTILKPMKNIDDGLEENLKSFFTLDYPDFDIIFGVDTMSDACLALIEQARKQYSSIGVRVVETGSSHAVNPKVDKLSKMAAGCRSPLLWVSDSNTRVRKDTLRSLVAEHLKNDSKIVFSPIRGAGSGTLGSIMANSYLNLFVSGSIVTGWRLFKKAIIVGKSMLIERQTLEELGGFPAFNCYLAEDYMMGEIYRENGKHISTNFTWITNYSSSTTIGTFYKRMERWAKMRIRIDPFFYYLEIFTLPAAIAFVSIFFLGGRGAAFFGAVFALKLLIDYLNLIFVNEADRADKRLLVVFPAAMLIKDAILLIVYFDAIFSRTVSWHGNIIKIGQKSRIDSCRKEL